MRYLGEVRHLTGLVAVPSDRLRIQVTGDFERGLSLRMARNPPTNPELQLPTSGPTDLVGFDDPCNIALL